METALIIAILSFLGSIVNSVIILKSKKSSVKKELAEANTIEYNLAISLVRELEKQILQHKESIEALQQKVKDLEELEGKHLEEKRMLEIKVHELTLENSNLKEEVKNSKSKYTEEITKLKKDLVSLREKLLSYENEAED